MTTKNQTVNKHHVHETQTKAQIKTAETKQKYVEIINSLSNDAFEIIGASLWPHEMQQMLLRAPLKIQKAIIEDILSDVEVINSLSIDALERIGGLILAEEMKEMLLCAPLPVVKQIIDEHLKEQDRINNLK